MSFSEIIKMTKQKAFLIQEVFAYEINSFVTSMKHIKKFCEKNSLPYEKK